MPPEMNRLNSISSVASRAALPVRPPIDLSQFHRIRPLWIIRDWACNGANIINASRTIEDVANMSLEEASHIRVKRGGTPTPLGEMRAARAISACRLFVEGLDINPESFTAVADRMSALMLSSKGQKLSLYKDLWDVSRLSALILHKLNRGKLTPDRVKTLAIAGAVHDLGKGGSSEGKRKIWVEVNGHYYSMTVEQATADFYSIRDEIKGRDETNGSFLERTVPDMTKRALILRAIEEAYGLKESDPVLLFFHIHTLLGVDFISGKFSELGDMGANIELLVALHHILESVLVVREHRGKLSVPGRINFRSWLSRHKKALAGVGDTESVDSVIAALKKNYPELLEDLMILVLADKVLAAASRPRNYYGASYRDRSTGDDVDYAVEVFHAQMRNNLYMEEKDIKRISGAFYQLRQEALGDSRVAEELRDLGLF